MFYDFSRLRKDRKEKKIISRLYFDFRSKMISMLSQNISQDAINYHNVYFSIVSKERLINSNLICEVFHSIDFKKVCNKEAFGACSN